MKFSEVKIGQEFKHGREKKTYIKVYTNKMFEAYAHELYVMIDVEVEVELISKCGNCKHYRSRDDGVFDCNAELFRTEHASDAYMDVDPNTFNCSEFEKKEGV